MSMKNLSEMSIEELRAEWKSTFRKATNSKDAAGMRKAIEKARAPRSTKYRIENPDGSVDEVERVGDQEVGRRRLKDAATAGGPPQLDVKRLVAQAGDAEKRGEHTMAASLWTAAAGLASEPLAKKYAENAKAAESKAAAKETEKPARRKKAKRPAFEHDARVLAKHPVGTTWTVSALGHEVSIKVLGNGFLASAKKPDAEAPAFESEFFRRLALLERRITGKPAKNALATFGIAEAKRSGMSHDDAVVALHEVNTVLGAGFKIEKKTVEADAVRLGELLRKVKAAARALARESGDQAAA